MNSVLLFRTDRVGDFLLSLTLIENIKNTYPNSSITVVASEKNYDYVKSFKVIDNVVLFKNNLLSKLKLILNLRQNYYDTIIVHDGKNRSKLVSFFLKNHSKIVCSSDLRNTQIQTIKQTCEKLNIKYNENSLNYLDNRKHNFSTLPFSKFILLHLDEKWIHETYIKKYINIEPSVNQLIDFISRIISKNKKIIITTGKRTNKLLNNIRDKIDADKVRIYDNQNLLELENIVFNSSLLITCHGWISHIASAKKIKQIDIIDNKYPYNKWTSHFRNYNCLYRKKFENLSDEIIKLI